MTKPSGPSSARFKPGDICRVCGWRRRRPGNRECHECIARQATEAAREDARGRERRSGKPLGRPRGGEDVFSSRRGECARCTAPHAPGAVLCAGHIATLKELAAECGHNGEVDE